MYVTYGQAIDSCSPVTLQHHIMFEGMHCEGIATCYVQSTYSPELFCPVDSQRAPVCDRGFAPPLII